MKWKFRPFKNVKVVLAVGFGLLIILMAISAISIVIIASEVQNDTALIQDNYAQSVRIIGHVQTDVVYLRLLVRDVIFFEDAKQRETLRSQIDSVMNEIADQFDKTRRIVVQPEEKQSYQAYIAAFDQFADAIHKVVDTVEAGKHEEAVSLYQTTMLQSRQRLDEISNRLVIANLHASAVTRDHIDSLETEFLQIGVGIVALSIIISVLIYYYVSRTFWIYVENIKSAEEQKENLLHLLQERQKKIEQLVVNMSSIEEDQRKRFAQELHDAIGHGLTVAKFHVDSAKAELDRNPAQARDHLEKSLSTIQESLTETKRISYDMRPMLLDDLGLVAAVKQLITDFERRTGIKVQKDFAILSGRLKSIAEITIYRIVQEAFSNIEKHSNAKKVLFQMLVRDEGVLVLSITDDGKGFDVGDVVMGKNSRLGLRNILERGELIGGTVLIESRPGQGCEINIEMPIQTMKENE